MQRWKVVFGSLFVFVSAISFIETGVLAAPMLLYVVAASAAGLAAGALVVERRGHGPPV